MLRTDVNNLPKHTYVFNLLYITIFCLFHTENHLPVLHSIADKICTKLNGILAFKLRLKTNYSTANIKAVRGSLWSISVN